MRQRNAIWKPLIAAVVGTAVALLSFSACSGGNAATPTATSQSATPTATPEPARPSNPGGPGDAINLVGDAQAGQQIFSTYCAVCHGKEGKGGVANPGSDDGTVPTLNPIDPTLVNADAKTFATNLDLFLQHGSTPEGSGPLLSMPPWGDSSALTQQEIANVIAYVMSLNQP